MGKKRLIKRIIYGLLTMAIAAFICFTSTRTQDDHAGLGGNLIAFINNVFFGGMLSESEQSSILGVAGKLFGHFLLFSLDGLFALLFVYELDVKHRYLYAILFGLALSNLGEFIQLFSAGRVASFSDVLIDFMGFLLIPSFTYMHRKQKGL